MPLSKQPGTKNENDFILNQSDIISNDEYEVFSSVLLQQDYFLLGRSYAKSKSLLLQNHTYGAQFSGDFEENSLKQFVIEQMTVKIEDDIGNYSNNSINKLKLKLDNELVEDFKNKNSHYYILQDKFSVSQSIVLLSKTERDEIFAKKDSSFGGWFTFYDRYPDSPGYIGLSRAGFNKDHTEAIIYFSIISASLAGHGDLIFLAKENGKWEIKKQGMLWIS